MKLEKINPFIQARYEHGYKSLNKFVHDIGISRSKYWTWETGKISCIRSDSSYDFQKMCKAFEWTEAEGAENISNMYQWSKNPDIDIVKPNWDDYKHIKPRFGKFAICVLDTTNANELKLLDNPLIEWREGNHLSRYEASKFIGIDSTDYALIEDGVFIPASDILKKITEATGLSVTQIAKIWNSRPAGLTEDYTKASDMGCVQDICDGTEPELEIKSVEKKADGEVVLTVEKEDKVVSQNLDVHAKLSYKETQEILDIIYGKVTLDEYRSIEIILNR